MTNLNPTKKQKKTPDIIYEDDAPSSRRHFLDISDHPFYDLGQTQDNHTDEDGRFDDEFEAQFEAAAAEAERMYDLYEQSQIEGDETVEEEKHTMFSTVSGWNSSLREMVEGVIIDVNPDGPNGKSQYTIEPIGHGPIFQTVHVEAF